MSEETRELIALIRAHLRRLEGVCRSIESALNQEIVQLGKTPMSALIVAGLLENYYTCLETILSADIAVIREPPGTRALAQRPAAEDDPGSRGRPSLRGVGGGVLPTLRAAEVPAFQTLLLRAGVRLGSTGLPRGEAPARPILSSPGIWNGSCDSRGHWARLEHHVTRFAGPVRARCSTWPSGRSGRLDGEPGLGSSRPRPHRRPHRGVCAAGAVMPDNPGMGAAAGSMCAF